jgi:hypothetical protein
MYGAMSHVSSGKKKLFKQTCAACRNVIADLGAPFQPPVTVTCSASGARVAVCSSKSQEYAVFYQPKGRPWRNSSTKERAEHLWPRIDAGKASQVCAAACAFEWESGTAYSKLYLLKAGLYGNA